MAPGLPLPRNDSGSEVSSTLPDQRSPLTSPDLSRCNSASPQNPALNNELASLSNKLIRAINHQTDLDDTLAETRHELARARQRVEQLEAMTNDHEAMLASGELIRREDAERQKVQLMEHLAREQKERGVMEKDKRGMEQELESLTTALFEEANQMVAAARKDREAADRRSDQLRAQLNDTELLLTSHQEQLAELKAVMHQMSVDREEAHLNATSSTAPSTPAMQMQDTFHQAFEGPYASPTSNGIIDIAPAPPTSFTHLLHPVLRTDLQAYDDFHTLLSISRKSPPSSRVSSGSLGTLNVTALSHLAGREQQHIIGRLPSTGSTTSLSTSATYPSSPAAPSSTNSSVSSRDPYVNGMALKETRFYKRVLTEDIEPTLRLDTAPGLSWLARRTVVNSMSEGSLVVEPMPPAIKYNVFACSLCGENRQDEEHARTHRFRTSENDNAQRYPLCSYCLTRVRASCDFLGFLRMLKDGHWRALDEEAEIQAWEECVRLRECMFWARIGGGVVPTPHLHTRDSPRHSVEQDHTTPRDVDGGSNIIHDDKQIVPKGDRRGLSTVERPNTTNMRAASQTTVGSCYADGVEEDHQSQQQVRSLDNDQSVISSHNGFDGVSTNPPLGLGIEKPPVSPPDRTIRDSVVMPGAFE
ncbi:MAG: hypothetical protein L6R42_003835 [Xanthoria sp. 1 TBL-2021]|nr:MAG: hypothetical protein L6R42_003835 [Xanthoria sp. 1 TBL-2021]